MEQPPQKITIKKFLSEILDIIEFKKGTPRTFLYLFYKPKKVIDSYLSNWPKKKGFVGPFRILYVCGILCAIYNEVNKSDYDENRNPISVEYENMSINQINEISIHKNLYTIIYDDLPDSIILKNKLIEERLEQMQSMGMDLISYKQVIENENNWPKNTYTEVDNYYLSLGDEKKNKFIKMTTIADNINLSINPIYYGLSIAIIISIFTFFLFKYQKLTFLEHVIVNLYPLGIIFMIYGFIDITESLYGVIQNAFTSEEYRALNFENMTDSEVVEAINSIKYFGLTTTLHNLSINVFPALLYLLERVYIVNYYSRIFKPKINIINLRPKIILGIWMTSLFLFFPSFGYTNNYYGKWLYLWGLRLNLDNFIILSWYTIIDLINLYFYFPIIQWYAV